MVIVQHHGISVVDHFRIIVSVNNIMMLADWEDEYDTICAILNSCSCHSLNNVAANKGTIAHKSIGMVTTSGLLSQMFIFLVVLFASASIN